MKENIKKTQWIRLVDEMDYLVYTLKEKLEKRDHKILDKIIKLENKLTIYKN